ncbi:hypothetical protein HDV00_002518 [Rhizophlyctis rosea]|nr:hypothetical protein HDV00_002518 [Rhizophlyctis rosea]
MIQFIVGHYRTFRPHMRYHSFVVAREYLNLTAKQLASLRKWDAEDALDGLDSDEEDESESDAMDDSDEGGCYYDSDDWD